MEFISQYSGIFALIPLIIVLVLFLKSPEKEDEEEKEEKVVEEVKETKSASPLDLNDEDATVACLVAAIDYRNETHKNVKIVSVKEVK